MNFHKLLGVVIGSLITYYFFRAFSTARKKMSKEKCKLISKKYGFDSQIVNDVEKAIK